MVKAFYADKIELIENAAIEADRYLFSYILKGVTEELSYTHLKHKLGMVIPSRVATCRTVSPAFA